MRAEFDESLVTGNEMIDTQHKELIDKINKLLDSCETSKEKSSGSEKRFDYLADYTEFHFRGGRKTSGIDQLSGNSGT